MARVVPADIATKSNGIAGLARIGGLVVLSRPDPMADPIWSEASRAAAQARVCADQAGRPDVARSGGRRGGTVRYRLPHGRCVRIDRRRFDAVQGGLAGLTKTVAREWPTLRCKALDVSASWSDSDQVAAAIVGELTAADPIEVGLDGNVRRGLEMVPTAITNGRSRLGPGDVVVLTGGARGVTAEVACALATESRSTLVLLGRSPAPEPEPTWLAGVTGEADMKRALLEHGFEGRGTPTPTDLEAAYRRHVANREVTDTVARIDRAGARAVYRSVDVRDGAAVATAFAAIHNSLGPIRGLIHAAGVLEESLDRRQDRGPVRACLRYEGGEPATPARSGRVRRAWIPGLVLLGHRTVRPGGSGRLCHGQRGAEQGGPASSLAASVVSGGVDRLGTVGRRHGDPRRSSKTSPVRGSV